MLSKRVHDLYRIAGYFPEVQIFPIEEPLA